MNVINLILKQCIFYLSSLSHNNTNVVLQAALRGTSRAKKAVRIYTASDPSL